MHPDLFGRRCMREQELSAAASSRANCAYRVLKTPVRRSQYLLGLYGIDAVGESSGAAFSDTALLLEVMEVRESLVEPTTTVEAVRVHELAARERCARTEFELSRAFLEAASGGAALERAALQRAARLTVVLQYYGKLLAEIETWLERASEDARCSSEER